MAARPAPGDMSTQGPWHPAPALQSMARQSPSREMNQKNRHSQRGTTIPPGTPCGDISTCHSWLRRVRKLAIEAAR